MSAGVWGWATVTVGGGRLGRNDLWDLHDNVGRNEGRLQLGSVAGIGMRLGDLDLREQRKKRRSEGLSGFLAGVTSEFSKI